MHRGSNGPLIDGSSFPDYSPLVAKCLLIDLSPVAKQIGVK